MLICCIKDTKAKSYHKPYSIENEVVAIREFQGIVAAMHGANMVSDYPEDFELHQIAEFDIETGKLTQNIKTLAKGEEVASRARAIHKQIDKKEKFPQEKLKLE